MKRNVIISDNFVRSKIRPAKIFNLGLIGCGSFGQFCLKAFSRMPEVRIAAVADVDPGLVTKMSKLYRCSGYQKAEQLIKSTEIEIVHLVTPPSSHHYLGRLAAESGKHVLCEKPLALIMTEGKELLASARKNKVIMPVNFVLRHVPIVDIVKRIISSNLLGEPIRAYFENYATDENLEPGHWFWDTKKSGGIFIEHGVHFFDLYRHWFGEAEIIWANTLRRDSTQQEDRVTCAMLHEKKILASHYHGFDQPKVLDRQVHQIIFERGEVTVRGWIPESFTIKFLGDVSVLDGLMELCPGSEYRMLKRIPVAARKMKGRGKKISADSYNQIEFYSRIDKQELYSQAIMNLLRDQLAYLSNRKHQRIIQEENGLEALRLANQAAEYAKRHSVN